MQLKNATAIVTGSSSGIGAAIAKTLARNGCHVVINYNSNKKGAEKTAKACQSHGVRTLVVKADVADDNECRDLVNKTLDEFGSLHILINNAGTTKFCDHENLEGLEKQDFLDLYSTNTVGAFQMIRAAAVALKKNEIAHVVNMASIAAITGVGSSIAYAASKGALVTMTMSLARALGPRIRINAVCPGFVQGEWLEKGLGKENYAKMLTGLKAIAPLDDTATPQRVAEVTVGIVKSMDWTTGETLLVDGGAHLQTAPLRK